MCKNAMRWQAHAAACQVHDCFALPFCFIASSQFIWDASELDWDEGFTPTVGTTLEGNPTPDHMLASFQGLSQTMPEPNLALTGVNIGALGSPAQICTGCCSCVCTTAATR